MTEDTKIKRPKFKQWLLDHGVSQAELARKVGLSEGYIAQLASGIWPLRLSADRIRDALNEMGHAVDTDDLFDDIKT